MTISCSKLHGTFDKAIQVTTNDPKHGNVTLHCKGQILEAVKLSPKQLNFGRVSRDSKNLSRKVVISRGDGGPLKPELINVDAADNLDVNLRELAVGERYELEVTLKPPFKTNRLSTRLRVKTGLEKAPTAEIPVYGSVVPRAMARPVRIAVTPNPKKDLVQSVTLRWDNDKPGKITGATVDNEAITAVVQEDEKGEQMVQVTVPAGFDHPAQPLMLKIQTDDPDAPEVEVPFSFIRRPRASTLRPTPIRPQRQRPAPEATTQPAPAGPSVPTAPAVPTKRVEAENPPT